MQPTQELYNAMDLAYQHFNQSLFNGTLPPVLFTTQRQHGVMGYFAPERWAGTAGNTCHEIAINPSYVGRAVLIEVFQTLVHEQCHCWQFCHGKPSRTGYHNKEWAGKMIAIGLMPSHTGQPGGMTTGQHMSDYPAKDGPFIRECETLVKSKQFILPWIDRLASNPSSDQPSMDTLLPALADTEQDTVNTLITTVSDLFDEVVMIDKPTHPKPRTKTCYRCTGCAVKVWGRPDLNIACVDCHKPYRAMS